MNGARTPDTVPGYYDIPLLKQPKWRWQIAGYFFLEGITSGCYILATMADLFAHGRHPRMVRAARYLSLATLIPCPPLLIADLGRPARFHHMLRIVKWTSPMNTGAWTLAGYGPFVAALALSEYCPATWLPARVIGALGLPFALTMLAYPGVLLSTTSNPAWGHTRVLGALFACSSASSAASALMLASGERSTSLHRMEQVARAGEAASLAAYAVSTRRAGKPLLASGGFWLGVAGGILAPALLERRMPRVAAAMSVAGALVLKWAITHAGRASALDPEAAHYTMAPRPSMPGWSAGDSIQAVSSVETWVETLEPSPLRL